MSKRFDLWAYVDSRDVAQSCLKGLEADVTGAPVMTIAAADTVQTQTNEELLAMAFPGCRLRPGTGPHDTLISIDTARRLIGYEPEWTWRKVRGL
jgi:nucleoside-diphosphate-sugar epimerase